MIDATLNLGRWTVNWIESTLTHATIPASAYCVDLAAIRDESDACHWARQLGEKTWVSVQDLEALRPALAAILERNRMHP